MFVAFVYYEEYQDYSPSTLLTFVDDLLYMFHSDSVIAATFSLALIAAFIVVLFGAAVLAWRWVLTTVAIFGALIIINQVYVLWLEPLAEH